MRSGYSLVCALALSAISVLAGPAVEDFPTWDNSDAPAKVSESVQRLAGNTSRYALAGEEDQGWTVARDLVDDDSASEDHTLESRAANCFPALGFSPPKGRVPSIPAYKWWCARNSEYSFLGFSYAVDGCPSRNEMAASFEQMRNQYRARYVRIYGACTSNFSFYDQVVSAAYEAGVGVYALVWFGFNGPQDKNWEGQLNGIIKTVRSNRYAPYVIRDIAIGSEALYDSAIRAPDLANRIASTKKQVSHLGVKVTTSEMAYKLNEFRNVLGAADVVQLNMLPYFSQSATTGNSTSCRTQIFRELEQMRAATRNGKKLIITQTGWPSNTAVWQPNSRSARSDVYNEMKYYDMFSGFCWKFKAFPLGGVGWFAHLWDDNTLPGWGLTKGGKAKFKFNPRTSC